MSTTKSLPVKRESKTLRVIQDSPFKSTVPRAVIAAAVKEVAEMREKKARQRRAAAKRAA